MPTVRTDKRHELRRVVLLARDDPRFLARRFDVAAAVGAPDRLHVIGRPMLDPRRHVPGVVVGHACGVYRRIGNVGRLLAGGWAGSGR